MIANEIFYVDDDIDDIEIFSDAVKALVTETKIQTDLHTYLNGQSFLKCIKERSLEKAAVILDINMPEKDGFEILTQIRNDPKLSKLPVVMYSTSADINSIKKSKELGANLYAVKPCTFKEVGRIINKILGIDWSAFTINDKNFLLLV